MVSLGNIACTIVLAKKSHLSCLSFLPHSAASCSHSFYIFSSNFHLSFFTLNFWHFPKIFYSTHYEAPMLKMTKSPFYFLYYGCKASYFILNIKVHPLQHIIWSMVNHITQCMAGLCYNHQNFDYRENNTFQTSNLMAPCTLSWQINYFLPNCFYFRLSWKSSSCNEFTAIWNCNFQFGNCKAVRWNINQLGSYLTLNGSAGFVSSLFYEST